MKSNKRYNWLNLLTTGDKILIVFILFLSLGSFTTIHLLKSEGQFVLIEVDDVQLYRLSLDSEQKIHVQSSEGEAYVRIHHGKVQILDSTCPAKICVKSGAIHRTGEIIVCAPNKIIVRIIGDDYNSYDVITE